MNDYKARVKFDNRNWIVFDSFVFEGKKYMYIGSEETADKLNEVDKLESYDGNIELEFIYELENGNYSNVTDKELLIRLFQEVLNRKIK